jgi:hypothetical protein
MMRGIRLAVGAAGAVIGLFGVYLLLGQGLANLLSTLVWLVGGLVLHDGVLAMATVAVVWVGALTVPGRYRSAVAAAFLVLATVTLTAVPVLGRFGARADNPTLLDRDYVVGWLVLAAAVVAVTAVGVLLRSRFRRPR